MDWKYVIRHHVLSDFFIEEMEKEGYINEKTIA